MPRELIDLNGDEWQVGRAPGGSQASRAAWSELDRVGDWLPAKVPGNVRADLMRAGRLPDLTLGAQFEASRWVDEHCWWYTRHWSLDVQPEQQVYLVLRGVDYVSDLFLNGRWLGRHEGMFSPQVHRLTPLLQRDNLLAIRILGSGYLPTGRSGPWEKLLNRLEARLGGMPGDFPDRRDTLKCQMSFGWDFCPPLRTMGIWDDAYAMVSGGAWLRQLLARAEVSPGQASLLVEIEIDALAPGTYRLQGTLEPETFDGRPLSVEQRLQVPAGISRAQLRWTISEPRLWWPWDQGRPDLYRLTIRLADGQGRTVDAESQVVGLRRIEMEGWTLRVNGRPVYARGGNWVPAHMLPGLVSEADYGSLLSLAREANMNLLRVWGGGLREKRPFYDLCDRLGILVWQEFPFACAFVTRFPRSPDYLALVERESRAIVRDLCNHPCLVLWCGGNEFSPDRNRPLVATLRQVVDEEDATRPFLPASPVAGDSHYWRVWHNYHPPAAYLADDASFASEFGLQAAPGVTSLRRFLDDEELWPPGPAWSVHGAGLPKLWRYARPFLTARPPARDPSSGRRAHLAGSARLPDLEPFVQASQRAQAHALQIAIEHYRRRKDSGCGGALVWQLNEPWPAISWALVDFYRLPKQGYDAVRRAFQPVLVSLSYPLRSYRAGDELPVTIWVIQDTDQGFPGCELEVTLQDQAGHAADTLRLEVDVPACSARPVSRFSWTLPAGDAWCLTCQLRWRGDTISSNTYPLGIHDAIQPSLRQRLWAWLAGRLIPG